MQCLAGGRQRAVERADPLGKVDATNRFNGVRTAGRCPGNRLLTPDSLFECQDLPGTEDDLSTLLCTLIARTLPKRQETLAPYNVH
jgi:hypothetical protein